MEAIIESLVGFAQHYPIVLLILSFLGTSVVVGSAYVVLTPTKADDAWLEKMENHSIIGVALRTLRRFSILNRK